jgi:hypothetical protein
MRTFKLPTGKDVFFKQNFRAFQLFKKIIKTKISCSNKSLILCKLQIIFIQFFVEQLNFKFAVSKHKPIK